MSFSSDTKAELCKIQNKTADCLMAECYGMWLFSKCFTTRETAYTTENSHVVHRMAELAAVAADVNPEISFSISRRQKTVYKLSLKEPYMRKNLLNRFGYTGEETALRLNSDIIKGDMAFSAFLRGAFLTSGNITNPNKDYHFEFSPHYKLLAEDFVGFVNSSSFLDINLLTIKRGGSEIAYIKDSGQIEDLLTYIGAKNAAMEIMQVKMFKEAINNINRKTNFETANMDKTYSASARQIAAIACINDEVGLDSLEDDLRVVAELRLHNPEMTLRDLAESLGMSRSSVNYKMKKLLEKGEKIQKRSNIINRVIQSGNMNGEN